MTPHTIRRSCTTELIRDGANLCHVDVILGPYSERRASGTSNLELLNLEPLWHYTRLTIVDLNKTHARCHPREWYHGVTWHGYGNDIRKRRH